MPHPVETSDASFSQPPDRLLLSDFREIKTWLGVALFSTFVGVDVFTKASELHLARITLRSFAEFSSDVSRPLLTPASSFLAQPPDSEVSKPSRPLHLVQ